MWKFSPHPQLSPPPRYIEIQGGALGSVAVALPVILEGLRLITQYYPAVSAEVKAIVAAIQGGAETPAEILTKLDALLAEMDAADARVKGADEPNPRA